MAEIDLTPADAEDLLAEIQVSIQAGNPVQPVQIHTGSSRFEPAPIPSGPLAELQARSIKAASELHNKAAQLDSIPPTPATLRGRLGRAAIQIFRRLLWWHTQSISEVVKAGQDLAQAQQAFSFALAQKTGELLDREGLTSEGLAELRNSQAKLELRLGQSTHELGRILDRFEALELKLDRETRARELLVSEVRDLAKMTEQLVLRISALEQQQTRTTAAPATVTLESMGSGFESAYLAFENSLRGSREEIKSRQAVYLPALEAAGIGGGKAPVVDVGCGRGEWLELLRERGLVARGVDRNGAMYELCRELNLDVIQADFLEFLRALPGGSVAAVTAFQLVEHLTFQNLLALLDEGSRVLKSGGLLILETPNPTNVLVGSHTFYMDPTHMRPLPPAMLRFFVESRGYLEPSVLELHPFPQAMMLPEEDNPIAKRFNEHFYGPRDYAVIARRP